MAIDSTGAGQSSGTRRHRLTLLFTDLSRSTDMGRGVEPEVLAEVLDGLRHIWRVAADRYGGRVVRTQGDGALLMFGFPQPNEDDGRRAAEAALDIQEDVERLVVPALPSAFAPLAMHSGIHAGVVLLSPGDIERGRFDLTGDVPNTAAHLCKLAKAGRIVASPEAMGPQINFFECRPASLQDLVGPAPLPCQVILRRSGVRRRFDATARRGLTPFVGRRDVVSRTASFLSGDRLATATQQRCLVVIGDPGMGKTRLLEETCLLAPVAATVLRGGCESYLGAEVLQPFAQMVRAFFGVPAPTRMAELGAGTREALQLWRERLGTGADGLLRLLTTDGETASSQLVTTGGIVGDLLAFFSELCAQQQVLMLIDDWQWADDASLQLLGALLDKPNGPRILLASRPREASSVEIRGARHLRLAPLTESDATQAIRRWIPSADPFLCTQIHDYSGGTPLFIEELCHSASVGALARAIEDRGAARNWLAGLAATRLARLPQPLADLVRVAAVIGNEVPLWLMQDTIGQPLAATLVATLAEADFLYPVDAAGAMRFKHGITRDAVYESIGLRERTALHERVLAALSAHAGDEGDDVVEALAHHSRGAGRWEQAVEFAERAGDKATKAFAMDRARLHYESAMAALDRVGPPTPERTRHWCSLSHKLGMTCIFDPLTLGDDPSTFERAVSLAQELGDTRLLTLSKYWLAYICYGLGRFRQSLRHSRDALALARQAGESRLAVQIEATLGQVLAATCDYSEAIERIDVAVDAKRQRSRPRGGLAIGSAYALACKGGILADRGEFAAAHACFDEAIDLLAGSTHPVGNSVRNWIAVSFNWQGRWDDAQRVASDSLRIAENTRALLLLSAARSSSGYAAWASEGGTAGLAQQREAMQWMDQHLGRFYTSIYSGWLVATCVTEGCIPEARRHAHAVFQRARQGERLGEAVACRSLAWAALGDRGESAAERWMKRAEAAALRRGSPREEALNRWMRGQIALRLGRREQALRSLGEAAGAFERFAMHWHAAGARRQAEAGGVQRPGFN